MLRYDDFSTYLGLGQGICPEWVIIGIRLDSLASPHVGQLSFDPIIGHGLSSSLPFKPFAINRGLLGSDPVGRPITRLVRGTEKDDPRHIGPGGHLVQHGQVADHTSGACPVELGHQLPAR